MMNKYLIVLIKSIKSNSGKIFTSLGFEEINFIDKLSVCISLA